MISSLCSAPRQNRTSPLAGAAPCMIRPVATTVASHTLLRGSDRYSCALFHEWRKASELLSILLRSGSGSGLNPFLYSLAEHGPSAALFERHPLLRTVLFYGPCEGVFNRVRAP